MLKSARLAAFIAGLIVCLLPCAQLTFIQAHTSTEPASSSNEGSSNGKIINKKARKKRKKKRTDSIPYLGMQMAAPVTQNIGSLPTLNQAVTGLHTRPTNRITRTPGLHITPVVRSQQGVPAVSVSNFNPITIFDTNPDTDPFPAEPYSSDIDITNLAGVVTSVSVTINGLAHPNPDDLDMLLIAPDDRTFHFWSDVGGGALLAPGQSPQEITVTVSDAGAQPLPDEGPLVSNTTYRPFNADTLGDTFPVPAPGGVYNEPAPAGTATFASVFNGMNDIQSNGTWRLFVTDDQNQGGGTIARGWTLNITTQIPVTTAGQLVISEFRTSGPLGPNDEFVELYNTTGTALTIQSSDESEGLGVFASDGILRCVVPNGTIIPISGHYLCANDTPAGAASTSQTAQASAPADQFFQTGIPTNAGLAIFNTSATGETFQVLANRIDAVGPTTVDPLYREGAGYNSLDQPFLDHAFYRDLRPNGEPKDTNNNSDDFLFVDTSGALTSSGQRLGAPSPEGSLDLRTSNSSIVATLPAPCMAATDAPNRVRTFTSNPANNSTFGTLSIRRAITNVTVNEITALRFKVIAITSYPAPQGVADLRLLSSRDTEETDPCSGGVTFNLMGLRLEGPAQPAGGAFNSNASADILSLGQPLQPGQTIFVNFILGVQQTGRFHFFVNIETLP